MTRAFLFAAGIWACAASSAFAQSDDAATRAAALARESCTVSSADGGRTRSDGTHVVTLPGSREEVVLSEERWKGIQQVLREHQKDESRNFRDCIRDLTPQFLAALVVPKPTPKPNTFCAYENDGYCDVPGDCPLGTDINDCSQQPQPQPLQSRPLFCCDSFGNARCEITEGIAALGTPCFCYGIPGTGYQCSY